MSITLTGNAKEIKAKLELLIQLSQKGLISIK